MNARNDGGERTDQDVTLTLQQANHIQENQCEQERDGIRIYSQEWLANSSN